MSNVSPIDGFDYRKKSDVLMPALKGGAIIGVGLLVFNALVDKPVVGDALVAYRRSMHRFFRFLGGKNFNDRQILDAAAATPTDFIISMFSSVFIGRLGFGKGNGNGNGHLKEQKLPPGLEDLSKDPGPQI